MPSNAGATLSKERVSSGNPARKTTIGVVGEGARPERLAGNASDCAVAATSMALRPITLIILLEQRFDLFATRVVVC